MCICKHSPGESGPIRMRTRWTEWCRVLYVNGPRGDGRYVGAILFFVTLGIIGQFRSRAKARRCSDEREAYPTFFIIIGGNHSPWLWIVPSVLLRSLLWSKTVTRRPKSSRDQGHPPRAHSGCSQQLFLRSGLWHARRYAPFIIVCVPTRVLCRWCGGYSGSGQKRV